MRRLAEGREALLIEGTGHAGVGAGHRALQRGRRGAPASAGGHRQRGRRRPAHRRDRPQRSALRAARRAPCRRRRQQGRRSTPTPHSPTCCAAGLARHGIQLLGTLPYRPILSTPPWRCSSSRCTVSSCIRATTWTGPSSTSPSATCSHATWSSASARAACSSCPATVGTSSHAAVTAHRAQRALRPRARPAATGSGTRARAPDAQPDRPGHGIADGHGLHGRLSGHASASSRPSAQAGLFAYLMEAETYEVASRGPRPARQDAPRRPRQDRGDQAPCRRPLRRRRVARTARRPATPTQAWCAPARSARDRGPPLTGHRRRAGRRAVVGSGA